MQKRVYALTILLLGLAAFILLVFVWQISMQRSAAPSGGAPAQAGPPRPAQPAGAAYTVFQDWSRTNWADDAVVIACTTIIHRRRPGGDGWTFQAYSAQKNRLMVALVQEQEVRVLREISALYHQTALPVSAWKKESAAMIDVWWREGGSTRWNAAGTQALALRLGVAANGVPTWQFSIMTDDLNLLEYWEIRADTGALLEHSRTGGEQ